MASVDPVSGIRLGCCCLIDFNAPAASVFLNCLRGKV
jgi:hypothetical protein